MYCKNTLLESTAINGCKAKNDTCKTANIFFDYSFYNNNNKINKIIMGQDSVQSVQ